MNDHDRFWDLNNVYRYRNENLAALGFNSYRAYLNSDLWQSIRERVFAERGRKCERCFQSATHVHHRSYDPATLRGDILGSLTVTCASCHRKAERPERAQRSEDRFNGANDFYRGRGARKARKAAQRREQNAIERFKAGWAKAMGEIAK